VARGKHLRHVHRSSYGRTRVRRSNLRWRELPLLVGFRSNGVAQLAIFDLRSSTFGPSLIHLHAGEMYFVGKLDVSAHYPNLPRIH